MGSSASPDRGFAVPDTWRALLAVSLPMAAAFGFGFFLHYANRTVLGWHSEVALAASLPAGMSAWTIQSLFLLSCGYLGTFAAQHVAAGEDRHAGSMVWPMLVLVAGAVLLCALIIPFRWHIAGLFGVSDEVRAPLASLLGWYLAETPLLALASGLSGFAGGIGRTGLVMAMSALGCVVCMALNVWLVLGGLGVPALGVTGAGLAGVLTGVIASGVWAVWMLSGERRRRFAVWEQRRWIAADVARFIRHALPRGASEVCEMIAFVAFSAVIARLGTQILAASNAAFSTYLLLVVPVIGFAQGVGIAVGQAQGAGRSDLARLNVRRGLWITGTYGVVVALLLLLMPQLLLSPIRGEHLSDAAWQALLHDAWPVCVGLALSAVPDCMHHVWRFALNGAGDTRWPFVVMVGISVLFMAAPAWLAHLMFDDPRSVLWASYLILAGAMLLMMLAMWWRFARGPWASMSVRC